MADRAPQGGPPVAVPLGAEEVAAEEAPGGRPVPPPVVAPAEAAASPPAASASAARPVFRRPEHVRALYLNAWAAGSRKRLDELIEVAKRTEINAFVIDIKDASGYVSHDTRVPLAREIGATGEKRIRDLPGLLHKLADAGIYPIARIVIVRDPVLSAGRPALAVQSESGRPWRDEKGIVWMNIAQEGVWAYNVDLAEEVARMGFPEIQWDYVRFPDAPRAVMAAARFPGLGEGGKPAAVRDFLTYADRRLDGLGLDVTVTADVFGITTTTEDVGIGQIWERFIDRVDVALPMVYPSHYYPGSFGFRRPNAYPYEVVKGALDRALERSRTVPGAGRVRPWLQDFDLGAPAYGAPEVRAQIQAVYDAGLEEWVLWNAGSRYTESALQPDGGWEEEPVMRLADRIVPVSQRFEVMKEAHRPAAGAAGAGRARAPTSSAARAQPRLVEADSLRRWVDSAAGGKDTTSARR